LIQIQLYKAKNRIGLSTCENTSTNYDVRWIILQLWNLCNMPLNSCILFC